MKRKNIVYFIVIFITMIQCFILLSYKDESVKNINEIKSEGITEVKNAKYIKEIEKDFKDYNTLTILNYNKAENGLWQLNCKLEGSKEDILNDLGKIDYYKITNYSLKYENNNVLLEVDLLSK
ncbi:hypothetical protein ACQPVP_09365 [Clostridium nigeriense]|uniref:hypothetical protein n=1 Tax=Clostridium nigeriense TaxID=1805470 RepID=UPI003D33F830